MFGAGKERKIARFPHCFLVLGMIELKTSNNMVESCRGFLSGLFAPGDLIVSGFPRRQNGNANGVYAIRGDTGPDGCGGQLEVTHYSLFRSFDVRTRTIRSGREINFNPKLEKK